uniref:Tetratricopeptide repeat-containing protein n=1 Tax=Chromera velia CCMP2878 TaxID=1169474 RepID=A0A0G4I0Y9_9ALVE|eukprot:Cvel_10040.t1-p1 / transcript=Cvel_10040.t1 / gene=Cvel_10040 / organism=Chromera_velia_CCMP2878 / gene_product=hypothetical protein / transcript_product=hypothetical protein / location=Cvel_scaffold597:23345-25351(+) / protein_length=554 / sequence_SO=supercontig / SO=protein_coding / is_pseudo=false
MASVLNRLVPSGDGHRLQTPLFPPTLFAATADLFQQEGAQVVEELESEKGKHQAEVMVKPGATIEDAKKFVPRFLEISMELTALSLSNLALSLIDRDKHRTQVVREAPQSISRAYVHLLRPDGPFPTAYPESGSFRAVAEAPALLLDGQVWRWCFPSLPGDETKRATVGVSEPADVEGCCAAEAAKEESVAAAFAERQAAFVPALLAAWEEVRGKAEGSDLSPSSALEIFSKATETCLDAVVDAQKREERFNIKDREEKWGADNVPDSQTVALSVMSVLDAASPLLHTAASLLSLDCSNSLGADPVSGLKVSLPVFSRLSAALIKKATKEKWGVEGAEKEAPESAATSPGEAAAFALMGRGGVKCLNPAIGVVPPKSEEHGRVVGFYPPAIDSALLCASSSLPLGVLAVEGGAKEKESCDLARSVSTWRMRIEWNREAGNGAFRASEFVMAVGFYKNGLQLCEVLGRLQEASSVMLPVSKHEDEESGGEGDGGESDLPRLRVFLLSNCAQAFLKIGRFREARNLAAQALQLDGLHEKSRMRFDAAVAAIEKCGY